MEIVICGAIVAFILIVSCLSSWFASFVGESWFYPIVIFMRFGVVLYYIRKYSKKK